MVCAALLIWLLASAHCCSLPAQHVLCVDV
jgi:hypothetical protein